MIPGSLGFLGDLALQLAGFYPRPLASFSLLLFAGDHGVHAEGVTYSPQEITRQQTRNFASGGGACALFAKLNGVDLKIIDVGVAGSFDSSSSVIDRKVGFGTKNFLHQKAMTDEECASAIEAGRAMTRSSLSDLIGFGEMGVANTASSSAIVAALLNRSPEEVTDTGSGLSESDLRHKIEVVRKGLALHPRRNPLDVLSSFGGFEHAAIVGGILEAYTTEKPILLDGFVVGAAALVAAMIDPNVKQNFIFAHRSGMKGSGILLEALGCTKPILDFGMYLGEGTGALTAWPIVRQASHILWEMSEFEQAEVTDSTAILRSKGLL
jgi:nicotinate-nucleotide--dimethylbenzimidazole phosphoribosyltransferase